MLNILKELPFLQNGADSSQTFLLTFGSIGLVILVMYFLIIRPQSKQKKQLQAMISALKKGEKVTTIGGIRGVITAVKEDTVIVKVDNNTKMEFSKSAISGILDSKETTVEKK